MKKNTRYILITLAAAVVLGGAVTALLLTKPQAEDSSSSSYSTASSTTVSISLFSYVDSEVASIQVKNTNDTFTIHAKTETSSASSEDEEDTTTTSFYLDGVDEKIQNSTASTLAIYGYSLSASNEIGDVARCIQKAVFHAAGIPVDRGIHDIPQRNEIVELLLPCADLR